MSRFKLPTLYPIVNIGSCAKPEHLMRTLLAADVALLQIRAKGDSQLLRANVNLALALRAECSSRALIIVNDDIELSLELGADGVHLGQEDADTRYARQTLGPDKVIGFSTHSIEQLQAAQTLPVDYLGFGPVFLSGTKHGHAAQLGEANVRQAAALSKKPFTAIGGVTKENAGLLFKAGACSVAVVGDLEQSTNVPALLACYEQLRDASRVAQGLGQRR